MNECGFIQSRLWEEHNSRQQIDKLRLWQMFILLSNEYETVFIYQSMLIKAVPVSIILIYWILDTGN